MPMRTGTGQIIYLPGDEEEAPAATPWYNAGGAPNPIAVWQPKAGNGWTPANIAGSYVNRANPGTYNAAPGTAPAWAAATGWTFTAASLQYLTMGYAPQPGDSLLVVVSGITNAGYAAGVLRSVGGTTYLAILPNRTVSSSVYYLSRADAVLVSPVLTAGCLAVTGSNCFRNGADEGNIAAGGSTGNTLGLFVGALNTNSVAGSYLDGIITAAAVWAAATPPDAYMSAIYAALVAAGLIT